MKVILHPLFIAVLLISFLLGFGWIALALLSAVILHELSHMVVANFFGVRADKLRLLPFGAEVNIDGVFLAVEKKVLILLAGSFGNLAAAIILSSLLWLFPQFFLVAEILIIANAVPGILNLLPVYPLDGGKIIYLVTGKCKWVIWFSNVFFGVLFFTSCLFFFNIALVVLCIAMIININLELKATNYAVYIKTLDKFCVDFINNNTIIEHEDK